MGVFLGLLAVFAITLLINEKFHISGFHNYGFKDDDYYEHFYIKKIPKLKVSPDKVKQFFVNHLSWFPNNVLDEIREEDIEGTNGLRPRKSMMARDSECKNPHTKPKNFTEKHITSLKGNLTIFKNESIKLMQPIVKRVEHTHFADKVKNLTHPFRPRVIPQHTTQLKYMLTTTTVACRTQETPRRTTQTTTETTTQTTLETTTQTPDTENDGQMIQFHQKNNFANLRKDRTIWRGHPRKIRVYVDIDKLEKTKTKKAEKHTKSNSNGTEPNNSTHVLETAEEMATDLAGRVTNLWKCVVGSHRNPQIRDVKYYLYTRRNIIEPELLAVNYNLIKNKSNTMERDGIECAQVVPSEIDDFQRISDENREIIRSNYLSLKAPTKILIHGYTGSYKDTRMAKIKDAYLSTGRFNVIQVDWEVLAAPPCYIRVTHNSRFVGEIVAKFIDGLHLVGVNMSLVHLVGFSLGAQVAGLAGNRVTLTRICRITGLDPALPLFLHTDSSGHLDKYDADFVDVIHTCGGILAMLDPVGHVDFYPNGGSRQPGCEISNLKCSHSRAPQYYAESVSSKKKFTGQLCSSWEAYTSGECNSSAATALMGEPCSIRSEHGKYYLATKSKEPFAG